MRGKAREILSTLSRSRRVKETDEELQERFKKEYPLNGTCPVKEETGDGRSVGRCSFPLRGTFCPRHGNLEGLLEHESDVFGYEYKGIKESYLKPREDREMLPVLFKV